MSAVVTVIRPGSEDPGTVLNEEQKKTLILALFSHRHTLSQTIAQINARVNPSAGSELTKGKLRSKLRQNEELLNLLVDGQWQ